MRWLDDYLREADKAGPVQQRLAKEREFVEKLWGSAFRAGASASLSVPGQPNPKVLAQQTLDRLLELSIERGHRRQVSVLEDARGRQGWLLAYYTGWNQGLDLLQARQREEGTQKPRLYAQTSADLKASELLTKAQKDLYPEIWAMVDPRVEAPARVYQQGKQRITQAAQQAASRARQAIRRRTVQALSRMWPGHVEGYDLGPPDEAAAQETAQTTARSAQVIPISSRRSDEPRRSSQVSTQRRRQMAPRPSNSWPRSVPSMELPPIEAYEQEPPYELPQPSLPPEAYQSAPIPPAATKRKPVTERTKPLPKPKRPVGRPKGSKASKSPKMRGLFGELGVVELEPEQIVELLNEHGHEARVTATGRVLGKYYWQRRLADGSVEHGEAWEDVGRTNQSVYDWLGY